MFNFILEVPTLKSLNLVGVHGTRHHYRFDCLSVNLTIFIHKHGRNILI